MVTFLSCFCVCVRARNKFVASRKKDVWLIENLNQCGCFVEQACNCACVYANEGVHCFMHDYACVCVRVSEWSRPGGRDLLRVAASLRGWPDLCLQLRFTGQQQTRGVTAWQQRRPCSGLMTHQTHTCTPRQMCVWRERRGAGFARVHANMQVEAKAGKSWNINTHRCINIDTHSDFRRDSWKTQPRSMALFREHTAFVWATMI